LRQVYSIANDGAVVGAIPRIIRPSVPLPSWGRITRFRRLNPVWFIRWPATWFLSTGPRPAVSCVPS